MAIDYDPKKRAITLYERGLDFDDAATVFAGIHATLEDDRKDYGEPRFITAGFLKGRMVVLVARKSAPCHLDEVRTCERRRALVQSLWQSPGLIPTTPRN